MSGLSRGRLFAHEVEFRRLLHARNTRPTSSDRRITGNRSSADRSLQHLKVSHLKMKLIVSYIRSGVDKDTDGLSHCFVKRDFNFIRMCGKRFL
jgi:hypothetical protein